MKTTIYGLLGMIKDGKAPKRIIYEGCVFEYDEDSVVMRDYYNKEFGHLFDDIDCITEVLNDEIEILETTITYNQDNNIEKVGSIINQAIRRVIPFDELKNKQDKIEKIPIKDMKIQATSTNNYCYSISQPMKIIINKINEIIDKLNKEN